MWLTETWTNNKNTTYTGASHNTNYFIQISRTSHGDELSSIINYNIKLIKNSNRTFNYIDIILIYLKLPNNANILNILLLYRPQYSINHLPTKNDILHEVNEQKNVIILSDFNINSKSIVFSNILNDLNIIQHINEPIHD